MLREGVTGVWEPPGAAVCPSGRVSDLVLLYTRCTVDVTNHLWNDRAPMVKMSFIAQGGEGQRKTNKKRIALLGGVLRNFTSAF